MRDAETTIFAGASAFVLPTRLIEPEQDRPKHEELQQRLPQQPELQGVYQIGDV